MEEDEEVKEPQKEVKIKSYSDYIIDDDDENPEISVPSGEEIIKEIKNDLDPEVIWHLDKRLKMLLKNEILPTDGETDLSYNAIAEIWKAITNFGKKLEVVRAVDIYGSIINGLAIRGNSDLDLTITVDDLFANQGKIL